MATGTALHPYVIGCSRQAKAGAVISSDGNWRWTFRK